MPEPAPIQPRLQRIGLLDSFRFVAILLVIGFHYFARFEKENIYPYGDVYAHFFLFKYGALGVQFFFMVSGFVIFMTLEKSRTLGVFLLKRLIRLYPALLLCTLVVFFTVPLLDTDQQQPFFHRPVSNLLPSLTFIDPFLWELVFPSNTGFIDGVHWSLLVEVKFYLIAGVLYFIRKEKGLQLWIAFVSCVSALLILIAFAREYHLVKGKHLAHADSVLRTFLLKDYLLYFTAGILFFALYSNKKIGKRLLPWIVLSSICFLTLMSGVEILFFCFFTLLFLVFIYRPQWLNVLRAPLISRIGLISYPLYLVHQNLGVLLIYKLPHWFHFKGTVAVAVFVIVLMIVLAYLIDTCFDRPCQRMLSYLFFKRKQAGGNDSGIKPLLVKKVSE